LLKQCEDKVKVIWLQSAAAAEQYLREQEAPVSKNAADG
jgi:hypothetical protein